MLNIGCYQLLPKIVAGLDDVLAALKQVKNTP
jgi:hypothetical protein